MATIEATLTVYHIMSVEVPDDEIKSMTVTDLERVLEEAYADGETGVLDDHEISDVKISK